MNVVVLLIFCIVFGGFGICLWLVFWESMLKFFMCLVDDQSLLQKIFLCIVGLLDVVCLFMVINCDLLFCILDDYCVVNCSGLVQDLLLELMGCNIVLVIVVVVLYVQEYFGDQVQLLIFFVDYLICDEQVFVVVVVEVCGFVI